MAPSTGLTWAENEGRFGPKMVVPPLVKGASASMKTLRDASFNVEAPKLFNAMPKIVRTQTDFPAFKAHLDVFLNSIPDRPRGSSEARTLTQDGQESNSLKDRTRARADYLNWKPPVDQMEQRWIARQSRDCGADIVRTSPSPIPNP